MTVLIVDDEYYSVESLVLKLKKHLDESDQILTAYNMHQALQHFQQNQIDLMICDIEMPGGSGLELLEQIRQSGNDVFCIFLTAYDRFEYISQAMKLSSIDYLLKPVDSEALYNTIDRCIKLIGERTHAKQNQLEASYWKNSEIYIAENALHAIISGEIPDDAQKIASALRMRNLSEKDFPQNYLPLLLQHIPNISTTPAWEQFDFIIKNNLREFFYSAVEVPCILRLSKSLYLMPLNADLHSKKNILERCKEGLSSFAPYFQDSFNFYLPRDICSVVQLRKTVDELRIAARRHVNIANQIFDLSLSAHEKDVDALSIPLELWTDMLRRRQIKELKEGLRRFLFDIRHRNHVYREHLIFYYYELIHLLSAHLLSYSPESLAVFRHELSVFSENEVCNDFPALQNWTEYILALFEQCLESALPHDRTVSDIRQYIQEHLCENMSRDTLAARVYLHPDYLSYLFKKETGLSITNYIIRERIEAAKHLLSKSDLSIRDIAISCGFQNISYFARQFKKSTGMSPRDFRD